MSWWSIRTVYFHGEESGERFYEDRILLFRADTAETALAQAEQESERYLQINPTFQRIGDWSAFAVRGDNDLNGAEVWSDLSRSELVPTDYYKARYVRFDFELGTEDTTE